MSMKHSMRQFTFDLGKGIFASTVTGIGLQVGRDVYVYAKQKLFGKHEQPTLVRIAEPDLVPTTQSRCCDQK